MVGMKCKKDQHSATQVGSWGKFARRTYFNGDNRQIYSEHKDSVWFYVAISILYFVLIGVVLVILLFAPKFRPPVPELGYHENASEQQILHESSLLPTADESKNFAVTEKYFQASPVDPMYDIDPRSSIFRGDFPSKDPEARMRVNNKFLNV